MWSSGGWQLAAAAVALSHACTASVRAHGAVTFPPPRNAIDSDQKPWSAGVPYPKVPFQPWCAYVTPAMAGKDPRNLTGANGQARARALPPGSSGAPPLARFARGENRVAAGRGPPRRAPSIFFYMRLCELPLPGVFLVLQRVCDRLCELRRQHARSHPQRNARRQLHEPRALRQDGQTQGLPPGKKKNAAPPSPCTSTAVVTDPHRCWHQHGLTRRRESARARQPPSWSAHRRPLRHAARPWPSLLHVSVIGIIAHGMYTLDCATRTALQRAVCTPCAMQPMAPDLRTTAPRRCPQAAKQPVCATPGQVTNCDPRTRLGSAHTHACLALGLGRDFLVF